MHLSTYIHVRMFIYTLHAQYNSIIVPCILDICSSLELGPEYAGDVCVVPPWRGPVALKEYRAVLPESTEQLALLGGYHLQGVYSG